MSAYQRRKGANGEREIVHIHNAYDIDCKRISMMETGGIDKGDVEIFSQDVSFKGQVKIGSQVPIFFYKALIGFDILFVRRDRLDWLVTMDFALYAKMMTVYLKSLQKGGNRNDRRNPKQIPSSRG